MKKKLSAYHAQKVGDDVDFKDCHGESDAW
jgi:hypothetical protein